MTLTCTCIYRLASCICGASPDQKRKVSTTARYAETALQGEFRRQYEAAVEADAAITEKISELRQHIWNISQVYALKQNRYPFRGMLYRATGWLWLVIPSYIWTKMHDLQRESNKTQERVIYYQDRAKVEL